MCAYDVGVVKLVTEQFNNDLCTKLACYIGLHTSSVFTRSLGPSVIQSDGLHHCIGWACEWLHQNAL